MINLPQTSECADERNQCNENETWLVCDDGAASAIRRRVGNALIEHAYFCTFSTFLFQSAVCAASSFAHADESVCFASGGGEWAQT